MSSLRDNAALSAIRVSEFSYGVLPEGRANKKTALNSREMSRQPGSCKCVRGIDGLGENAKFPADKIRLLLQSVVCQAAFRVGPLCSGTSVTLKCVVRQPH